MKSCLCCKGRPIEMKLIGCDGERKQDGPAPDTVLRNNWSSTGMGKYRLLITFLKLLIIL
jgi:hypothetical protein